MAKTKATKVWRKTSSDCVIRDSLSHALEVSPVTAQILLNRGIHEVTDARNFLYGGVELLGDPRSLAGMANAVQRIKHAIAAKQKITIYGDYDVDGITATSLLLRVFKRLGAIVEYYIPERQSEGYGLNRAALEQLCSTGTELLVTVDCGISAIAEISALIGRLDIIVTDHHEPPETLPPAYAIINPKQPGCSYPDKNLAGVGVAFKLCQALWSEVHGSEFLEYLDVVAVGTVADVVPLVGENRVIVKLGLAELGRTRNPGLKALMNVTGIAGASVDTGKVGFVISPRLNAAGRVSHAAAGVELLTTDDDAKAAILAEDLHNENAHRQEVERDLLATAEKLLEEINLAEQKVLVLSGADWHPGVIGIVASRLVERYYRPVVMISIREGVGKGSCRSIPGFDMYRALAECKDILIQFGGHHQAAGLSVAGENIEALRHRLNAVASDWLTEEDYYPVLKLDSEVALEEVNAALMEQLACLAPHGMGNPTPVLYSEDLAVSGARSIGQEGRHLKLKVSLKSAKKDVVAWDMGSLVDSLTNESAVDLAFSPEYNTWQGQRTIQLRAHDVRVRRDDTVSALFYDLRNSDDHIGYICNLLRCRERVVLHVADRLQVVKSIRTLRGMLKTHDIIGLYPSKARRAHVDQAADSARCIVCCDELPILSGAAYVFASPPESWEAVSGLCRRAGRAELPVKIHFIFGRGDVDFFISRHRAGIPDRTGIGWLYYILKQEAKSSPKVELTSTELAARVSETAHVATSVNGIELALAVLEELNLIVRDSAISLKPEPKDKLDIDASCTFRESSQRRGEFESFAKDLMRVSVKEIEKKIKRLIQITNQEDGHGLEANNPGSSRI